ncbi:DedD protein [Acidisarcina polymorpha]|uniref:DedD protein n=2 Tax=Acidisarcina polymorpha TaxID=2211140 RepID=A0A2Z5FSJ4_9BACT|nr:DedD protein [Acidisarcina polymorpha]
MFEQEAFPGNEADFNLGLGSLIGIFFGLALVCGVFFGFGYMMGHRAPGAYVSSEPLYVPAKPLPVAPKPSAEISDQSGETSRVVIPTNSAASTAKTAPAEDSDASEPPHAFVPAAPPSTASMASARTIHNSAPGVAPEKDNQARSTAPGGGIMVQIAAVRNVPDAEALASALRKNGFTPAVRAESLDKLFHVQVGPFSSREEAKAMRQKLSSAGYNAFIK